MSSSIAHDNLVKKIVFIVGSRPDCRAWPNDTGVGRDIDDGHVIKFGLVGSSDVFAILNVEGVGVLLGFEAKTGQAVQTSRQKAFEKTLNRFGGYYFLVRESTNITACVEEARQKVMARMKSAVAKNAG